MAKNQCDGCCRGLSFTDSKKTMHKETKQMFGKTFVDYTGCSKHLYLQQKSTVKK